MKILIAGAGGTLGAQLVQSLKKDHQLIAQVRTPKTNEPQWPAWRKDLHALVDGDLRDAQVVANCARQDPEWLFYLASPNRRRCETEPEEALALNVGAYWNLLHICRSLKGVAFFSTQHVYGSPDRPVINESTETNPLDNYAFAHLLGEQVSEYFSRRAPAITFYNLRLSNGYGAPIFESNDCWSLAINDFCRSALQDHQITLRSDGNATRDFFYTQDLGPIMNELTKREAPGCEIINVASASSISIREAAYRVSRMARKILGMEVPIFLPGDRKLTDADIEPAPGPKLATARLQELAQIKLTSIDDGIEQTLNALKARG